MPVGVGIPNVASVGVAIVPNMSGFGRQLASGLPGIIGPALAGIGGIGTAVGGIFGAAVKEFVPLEATFARMVGLAGVGQEEIAGLTERVLELGPAVGKSPQELADALMFIVSSGFQGAAALEVLDASARAGAAGLGEVAVIADAVTSAVNAYGSDVLTASKVTDVLTAAVREGKIEADQFAPVLGKLLPTASALGIAFEDVAGVLAAMSRTGFDAAEAATSVGAIFSTLLKPAAQAQRVLEGAGLSMAELRDTAAQPGGLVEVMRILDTTLGDNEEALSAVVPNVRAFRGIMNLLSQDASVVDDILLGVRDSVGATDDAFGAVAETAEFKLAQAMATLKTRLVEVGAEAAPEVVKALEGIVPVLEGIISGTLDFAEGVRIIVEFFNSIPGPARNAVTAIGAVGAALVLLKANPVIGALTLVAGAITLIGKEAREHKQGVEDFAAALKLQGEAAEEATRGLILHRLEQDGVVESARKLGISTDVLVGAVLGEAAAVDILNRATAEADTRYNHLFSEKTKVRDATIGLNHELAEAAGLQAAETQRTLDARDATRLLQLSKIALTGSAGEAAVAVQEGGAAAAGAIPPTSELGDEAKTLADNLATAAGNQEELANALVAAADPLFNATSEYQRLQELLERVNEETETEPAGVMNPEEMLEVAKAVLSTNAAFEALDPGEVQDALTVLAGLFGVARTDIVAELEKIGIFIDEKTGEISFALTEGISVDGLAERLGADLNAEIGAAVRQVSSAYEISSPSKRIERELGIPIRDALISPMVGAGRELQAAISTAIGQGLNQTIPRSTTSSVPVAGGGDTITYDIDVHNATPERASESLQSGPLRMTLQGLARR
jgi:TP901 family phage tail tape measure protein